MKENRGCSATSMLGGGGGGGGEIVLELCLKDLICMITVTII